MHAARSARLQESIHALALLGHRLRTVALASDKIVGRSPTHGSLGQRVSCASQGESPTAP